MEEKTEEQTPEVDMSTWRPVNVPSPQAPTSNDPTLPIQATHPAVVAVCNILMYDMPVEKKAWHSQAEHARTRETMEQCISHLILQRRPTANQEWVSKLPEVSKRIERNLYYSARSIDEYSDPYTLVNRIQGLVKILLASAAARPATHSSEEGREGADGIEMDGEGDGEDDDDDDDGPDTDSEVINRIKAEPVSGTGNGQQPQPPKGVSADPNSQPHPQPSDPAADAPTTQLPKPFSAFSPGGFPPKSDLLQAPLYLLPLKEADFANEQAAAAAAASNMQAPMYLAGHLASRQVSSQGCSRVFIIKVLISVSEFVKGKSLPSIFTFKRELVMDWLISAKQACCLPTIIAEESYYGGPPFVDPDPSTHWSEPHQLYTWWKNNVERRSKFKVLQEDAKYKGLDPKRLQRARWCDAVVALSEVIRASSGNSNASRTSNATGSASQTGGSAGGSASASSTATGAGAAHSHIFAQHIGGMNSFHPFAGPGSGDGGGGGNHKPLESSAGRGIDALLSLGTQQGPLPGISQANPCPPIMSAGLASPLPVPLVDGAVADGGADRTLQPTAGKTEVPIAASMNGAEPASRADGGSVADCGGDEGAENGENGEGRCESLGNGPASSSTAPAPSAVPQQPPHPQHSPQGAFPPGLGAYPPFLGPAGAGGMLGGAGGLLSGAGQVPVPGSFRPMPPPAGAAGPLLGNMIPGTCIPFRNYSNTFPVKLYDLVSTEDETVVGWQGHGTSFQVRNMDKFVNEVLPKHFKHNNFTSFQRQLNLYGFRRSATYDKGAYYHPQFQMGNRDLAESIRRVLVPHSSTSSSSRFDSHSSNPYSRHHNTPSSSNSLHPILAQAQQHQMLLQQFGLPAVSPSAFHALNSMPHVVQWLQAQQQQIQQQQQLHSVATAASSGEGAVGTEGAVDAPMQEGAVAAADTVGSAGNSNDSTSGSAPASGAVGSGGIVTRSTATVNPMPLPSWLQGGNQQSNPLFGNSSAFWQNQNVGARMLPHPYFLPPPGTQQYPGGFGLLGGGLGGFGADVGGGHGIPPFDPTVGHGYGGGPFGVMSQLARSWYPLSARKVPVRRTAKRDGSGQKKAKLSAKDRKLHDMHCAVDAEQFLAGTIKSDRYHLGSGKRKGGRDDEEGAGKKGRGGRRRYGEEDDGDEEGGRRSQRKGKGSRRRLDDDDSVSSASVKGRRFPRGASSRNLASSDHFNRSGLSKISSIAHLVDGAEEDLLDLRTASSGKRRVHLDFTLPAIEALAAIRGDSQEQQAKTEEDTGPDYVCGYYRGALYVGLKDQTLHYKLHGSRSLPEALLKLNSELQSAAAAAAASNRPVSMIAAQNKNNAPRNTRVGEDFQCEVPAFSPPPAAASKGSSRRSATAVTDGLIWKPGQLSEECVEAFLELLKARKQLEPLVVGSVLVVRLAAEGAFRLCCVLDVHLDEDPTNGTPAVNCTARVFDGYDDYVVSAADCMSFEEGEMEQALQILAKHQGQLSETLVAEVDALLMNERANRFSHAPTSWSSDDVHSFCEAVRRYGDNIKKVWELKFSDTKRLEEVHEFFLRIYPHTQLGGAKRVVTIYRRGELAAAGFPDGEEDDGSEEEDEEEDSGDSSSVDSASQSNGLSDGEGEDGEEDSAGPTDAAESAIASASASDRASSRATSRRGRGQTSAVEAEATARAGGRSNRGAGRGSATAQDEEGAAERGSATRKRQAGTAEAVGAEAKEEGKRRRR